MLNAKGIILKKFNDLFIGHFYTDKYSFSLDTFLIHLIFLW